MKLALDKYLGRNIRLTEKGFGKFFRRGTDGVVLDNYFVVARVDQRLQKLVCYGNNRRIVVASEDVILI